MQQDRHNPYPWTWEPIAASVLGLGFVLVAAVHLGRTIACLLAGQGVRFTQRDALFTALWPILTGDASAGLAESVSVPPLLLGSSVLATELGLLALSAVGLLWALRRWGPMAMKGVATAEEAARLLGVQRLRKNRRVIRPDLYANRRQQPKPRPIPLPKRQRQPRAVIEPLARPKAEPNVRARQLSVALPKPHGFRPREVGWRIGTGDQPKTGELWCPWDRTAGVIGPQGSGKTLDVLTPALLQAPGAALVTLTKTDDLLLSITRRQAHGPVAVLDPFGLAPGLPTLVWDPVDGCVDPMTAERRAKAFTAGTVKGGAVTHGDDAARFYAAEAAKVVQAYLHAAALVGATLDDVLGWVASPLKASAPLEILREHPHAARFWQGLLHAALHGDDRTAGNTITTVQQAMSLFFQADIRQRCVPSVGDPATDVAELVRANGTTYLLGREDPYASASPLMTAFAEYNLDTALALANRSRYGRLCPPMLAVLDELPSTAPLPTLQTRMANERALGLSFIWASQTFRQLVSLFGEPGARALLALTNVLTVFGGSKDGQFNKEISELAGTVRIGRTSWQTGRMGGRNVSGEDIAVLKPEAIRELKERHALVIAENGKPIIAKLDRCIDGRGGKQLKAEQAAARSVLASGRAVEIDPEQRKLAALVEARRLGLADEPASEQVPA